MFPLSENEIVTTLLESARSKQFTVRISSRRRVSDRRVKKLTTVPDQVVSGSCFLAIDDRNKLEKRVAALREAHRRGASLIISPDASVLDASFRGPTRVLIQRGESSHMWTSHPIRHAAAAIAAELREQFTGPVILITGVAGKTTTKDLTVAALSGSTRVLSSLKTHNSNRAILRRLLKLGPRYGVGVFEVGARRKHDVRRIAEIARPTISYTTSIGPSHLESFGDIQAVLRAETEQYESLIASNSPVQVLANIDDPLLREYCLRRKASLPRGSEMYTVAVDGPADIRARKVRFLLERDVMRTHFVAQTPWGNQEISIPLVGIHNVRNALAAIALGMMTGLPDLEGIACQLDGPRIAANRSRFFQSRYGFFVLDDSYNSNPLSMKAALDTLAAIRQTTSQFKKIIAVVSDMNELADQSGRYHFQAGLQARKVGVSELIVGGKFGNKWESGFGKPVHRFRGMTPALQQMLGFVETRPEDVLFLIKASHGTGLHLLSQRLIDSGPQQ